MAAEPLAYLNGELLPAGSVALPVYDCGLVLGATLTELVRTFHHRLYLLDEHLDRLCCGLAHLRLDAEVTRRDLEAAATAVIQHNAGLLDSSDELGLVVFVTPGDYPTYSPRAGARRGPTVCAHTFPLPFELWAERIRRGQHLVTPAVRQVPRACYGIAMKHRSRIHYHIADLEVRAKGPLAVPLLLDLAGHVTETPTANFFMVERDTLVSPRAGDILPGISRGVVIQLAAELGMPFVERDILLDSVPRADEAFTASTPYCLMPATQINGQPIGAGTPGPVYRRLLKAWSRWVRVDIEQQILAGAAARQA
jgi:branched-subunit amino acid aminotransferase/4-amino-4-deoxychorismate lyase